MDSVVHFEMPYDDQKRMAEFYRNVFGWGMDPQGPAMGDYVLATTTEVQDGRPKNPGAINGGFFPRKPDWPAQHPLLVIAVDDIEASMKKVRAGGGSVFGEPMDIPGVGRYVAFQDTEKNHGALLQPNARS